MSAPGLPAASGAPPPNPTLGMIVNYHKFLGGNPADPNAWEPVSGDDFLHELGKANPVLAVRVKAIADGREPFPASSRMNPINAQLQSAVAQYDPQGYDSINNGTRAKVRADMTSGTSSLNIRNLNQAIGHLQAMMGTLPDVAGHGGAGSYLGPLATPVNGLINGVEEYSGQQGITNYEASQRALAGELAALFKGKGASAEGEVKGWMDQLSPNMSNDQKMGTARTLSELLKSRLDELHQQYKQGMGTSAIPFEILNKDAASAYKALSTLGKTVNPQPAAQTNSSDIDSLLKKYGAH